MQYTPRVKFSAALAANGDIIPGAAALGFLADGLSTPNHILLENPTTFAWEICRYDPAAASGSRKQTVYSSDSGNPLTAPQTGLTASFVAHPAAYVLNTHTGASGYAPSSASVSTVVVGGGAVIEGTSDNSINFGGLVREGSPFSTVLGGTTDGARTIAIGREAQAEKRFNQYSYNEYSHDGAVALGYRAATTAAGEVVLGTSSVPHASGVPIATSNPSGGGTFTFQAVAGHDGSNFILAPICAEGPFLPGDGGGGGTDFGNWVLHVQGVIVARASDAANDKVVKVEWVTGGTLAQTVMTFGANDINLGLALSAGQLNATVAAIAGLRLSGYLRIAKISWVSP